jgi:ATP-dependent helicase Lhr and Lhr-like helicase
VRGRLEGQGPSTLAALAEAFDLNVAAIRAALISLETEGFALAGHFTSGAADREWCERRLLARIHRYTINRLRAEIQPVSARDYLRFLFDWQSVAANARKAGPAALNELIDQLAGFEAPATAWERYILAARLSDYSPGWLDDACLSGRTAWMRLTPVTGKSKSNGRRAMPLKSTPISLLPRRDAAIWASGCPIVNAAMPSATATKILDFIRENGASFFEELVEGTPLLRTQVEEGLSELVALGHVRSDSFGGLRALLAPRHKGRSSSRRRKAGLEGAGRWTLANPKHLNGASSANNADRVEHIAKTLLRRYGVVFLRMLEREAAWLPKWRDLLRVYRKLEARGEIRGGRFVAGFSGEQFALPEAIAKLRATRRQDAQGALVSVSAADPLNLAGVLTPGPKLAALTTNRVLYRDGIPIAFLEAGTVRILEELDLLTEPEARMALLGHTAPEEHFLSRAQRASNQHAHHLTR